MAERSRRKLKLILLRHGQKLISRFAGLGAQARPVGGHAEKLQGLILPISQKLVICLLQSRGYHVAISAEDLSASLSNSKGLPMKDKITRVDLLVEGRDPYLLQLDRPIWLRRHLKAPLSEQVVQALHGTQVLC